MLKGSLFTQRALFFFLNRSDSLTKHTLLYPRRQNIEANTVFFNAFLCILKNISSLIL